jgi:hypothetical protein
MDHESSFQAFALPNRVVVRHDTPGATYLSELYLRDADILLEQLARAREAAAAMGRLER